MVRYKPSASFEELISRLAEIDLLLNNIRPFGDMSIDVRQRKTIIRSCIVLLCSHVEGYMEDLVEETINFLNVSAIIPSVIPLKLKAEICRKDILDCSETKDIERYSHQIENFFQSYGLLWQNGHSLPPDYLKHKKILTGFSNPTPKAVEKLFRLFGIDDIFSEVEKSPSSRLTKSQYISYLNYLLKKRNKVAHGDYQEAGTPEEVIEFKDIIKDVCRGIDIAMGKQLEQITGHHPWGKIEKGDNFAFFEIRDFFYRFEVI